MPPRISVVINTWNEAKQIGACIASVQAFADQLVVCDMHSTDATVELARQCGAEVYLVEAQYGDFGRLRHAAVSHANGDWILVLDADERLTTTLAIELQRVAALEQFDVVRFHNLYWYFGGWVRHGIFFHDNWPRFFRRAVYLQRYAEQDEPIHRDLSVLEDVARTLRLPRDFFLEHYAYPTIEKYVSKTIGSYARLEAEQLYARSEKFAAWRLAYEPAKVFFKSLIWRGGWRDGMRGFILTVLYAAYRFTTFANLWLLQELGKKPRGGLDE